jgi:hypothetical protein
MSSTIPLHPREQLYNRSAVINNNSECQFVAQTTVTPGDDDVFYLFLQKQKLAQRYVPIGYSLVELGSIPRGKRWQANPMSKYRVPHGSQMRRLYIDFGSSDLIAHVLHYPPPHANSFVIGPAVINNSEFSITRGLGRRPRTDSVSPYSERVCKDTVHVRASLAVCLEFSIFFKSLPCPLWG